MAAAVFVPVFVFAGAVVVLETLRRIRADVRRPWVRLEDIDAKLDQVFAPEPTPEERQAFMDGVMARFDERARQARGET